MRTTFEDKLKELSLLMERDPLSQEILELAKEIKTSCRTENEQKQLDDFVSKGINKLTLDVEELYQQALEVSQMQN